MRRPVSPSYMTSSPMHSRPASAIAASMSAISTPRSGVPSPTSPLSAHAWPSADSSSWPSVMREGSAWGLMTRSATMPEAVYGMSRAGFILPTTPFCPCRDVSLSPSIRNRVWCICTHTMSLSSRPVHCTTESTAIGRSRGCRNADWSRRMVVRLRHPSSFTSIVLPMYASPPQMRMPGDTRPLGPSFAYEPVLIPNPCTCEGRSNRWLSARPVPTWQSSACDRSSAIANRPRLHASSFAITESSWFCPSSDRTATHALTPAGAAYSPWICSAHVETLGVCGYHRRMPVDICSTGPGMPAACLPMAE